MSRAIKLTTEDRKLDHIKITLERQVESKATTLLDDIFIEHISLPEIDFDKIDTTTEFLGKRINAPLMITGMTGGHPKTAEINRDLAIVAEKYGIALGLGSQRAAIEDKELEWTFRIARDNAPTIPLVANIGGPQLVKGYGIREIIRAIEMIDADGIAIHLNPLQEAFQPEGDRDYSGLISKIVEIIDRSPVPVIIKETGSGLSPRIVSILYDLGINHFDVSGLGGTNWGKVEVLRAEHRGIKGFKGKLDGYGDHWGNPTAFSVISSRIVAPYSTIISSGGIRTGLDIVKSIVIGGDLGGFALPALRVLMKGGISGLEEFIEDIIYQVKVGLFLTGSSNVKQLRCKRFAILNRRLLSMLSLAGFDIQEYNRVKCYNNLKVPEGWMR
ncbi:MAG: type 2 isopentenyl-diphosphate Delta-isomerase [Desulfurococcales archaeon]|nr:type 2 isopentenyl-diphosphate Delta-isomerase [Desulfurococcales archaeon]